MNTLATEKREKVRLSDLDVLRQAVGDMTNYLTDKLNVYSSRLTEFDLRTNRLEDHCFKRQEPVIIQVNRRFDELKTEIYYRIGKFQETIAVLNE